MHLIYIGALLCMRGPPFPPPITSNLKASDTNVSVLGSSAHAVKWFATKELIIGKDHKEEIRMTYIPKHNSSLLCVLSFSTSDV